MDWMLTALIVAFNRMIIGSGDAVAALEFLPEDRVATGSALPLVQTHESSSNVTTMCVPSIRMQSIPCSTLTRCG